MKKSRTIVILAMFAAISSVLMFIEFPLPFLPPFLKIDLSNVPVLIGAFTFGPVYSIAILLVKDVIHLFSTQTGGVGELADFIVTSIFVLTAGLIYKKGKNRKSAIIGSLIGIITMVITGIISNKYLILPFYTKIMPIEAIINMCKSVNSLIIDVNSYLLYAVTPFNLLKGIIISAVTIIVYDKISTVIFKFNKKNI